MKSRSAGIIAFLMVLSLILGTLLFFERTQPKLSTTVPVTAKTVGTARSSNMSVSLPNFKPADQNLSAQALGAAEFEKEEAMRKDKLFAASIQLIQRRGVQRKYGFLLAELRGLDRATAIRLKEALAERELSAQDAQMAAVSNGVLPGTNEFAKIVAETRAEADRQIASLLGSRYEEFQELDRQTGSYELIDNVFGVNLAYAEAPLTEAQRRRLAIVMTEIHYSMGDAEYARRVREPVNPDSGLSPLNEELIARTQSFLTPAQLEVLKAYQLEQTQALQYGAPAPPFR